MKTPLVTTVCVFLVIIFGVGCKRVLNQDTADNVIPNGMSEAQVYDILGTNGSVTFGRNGEKFVHYFFPFTGPPLRIKTHLAAMTVIFSNGVVISKSFPEVH